MSKERIQYLLNQYAANLASREEVEELFVWLKEQEGDDALKKFIVDAADKEVHYTTLPQSDWDNIWHSVESATTGTHTSPKVIRPFWRSSRVLGGMAAAVLLLVIAGSAWFFFSRPENNGNLIVVTVDDKKDITPGSYKALLTLADGSTIVLDTVQTGLLALQGQTKIIKQNTGQLIYNSHSTSEQKAGEVLYNTVATPHGGQFQLVLPDGTKVWLNAGSSLCFPATFSSSKRMVELTGEAYFEVATLRLRSGQKRPFIVSVLTAKEAAPRGQIEVLGTHFNVNAYNNESVIKTTLLEGKVKVSTISPSAALRTALSTTLRTTPSTTLRTTNYKLLLPGKQAILNTQTQTIKVTDAYTEQAVAWKNGYFRFKETGIRELMRQVERWYDVEVEYRTDRTDQYYTGVVSRSQNISALLQTLELTGTVHFQIDNNPAKGKQGKIIVLP